MQAARGATLSTVDGPGPEAPSGSSADVAVAPRPRRVVLFATCAVVAYALDVVTKVIAVEELSSPRRTIEVVPRVLDLTFVRNPGAAFGLATGATVILSLIAIVVCLVVVRLAARLRSPLWAIAFGLLLAGALGNLTDRVFRQPGFLRGHVVDFLALPSWPVFNVADMCVTSAAVLIALQAFRGVGVDGTRADEIEREPEPEHGGTDDAAAPDPSADDRGTRP